MSAWRHGWGSYLGNSISAASVFGGGVTSEGVSVFAASPGAEAENYSFVKLHSAGGWITASAGFTAAS